VIRNQKRREEFLNVKNAEHLDLETARQLLKHFQCDQCEHTTTTKKALKVHKWKTHNIEKFSPAAACPRDGSSDPPPGVPVDEFGLPLPDDPGAEQPVAVKPLTAKPVKSSSNLLGHKVPDLTIAKCKQCETISEVDAELKSHIASKHGLTSFQSADLKKLKVNCAYCSLMMKKGKLLVKHICD
jgi:predicted small metal-binding protein